MALGKLDDWRDTNIIGDWVGKIGHVKAILSVECSPDAMVWANAAFTAVPMLLWSLLKPTPLDVAFDTRFQIHKRRRKMAWRGMNIVPAAFFDKQLGWAGFRVAQIAQKIGWYMLIVDSGLDATINWTSMAYERTGCIPGAGDYAQGHATPPADQFPTGDWHPWGWTKDYDPHNWISGTHFNLPPGAPIHVGVGWQIKQGTPDFGTGPPIVETRLFDVTNGVAYQQKAPITPAPGQTAGGVNMYEFEAHEFVPRVIEPQIRVQRNMANIEGSTVFAIATSNLAKSFLDDP